MKYCYNLISCVLCECVLNCNLLLKTVVLHHIFVETGAFYFSGFTDEWKVLNNRIYLKYKSIHCIKLILLLSVLVLFSNINI